MKLGTRSLISPETWLVSKARQVLIDSITKQYTISVKWNVLLWSGTVEVITKLFVAGQKAYDKQSKMLLQSVLDGADMVNSEESSAIL